MIIMIEAGEEEEDKILIRLKWLSKNRSGARGTVELILFKKEYNNSQVFQRERINKMSDAFTDVAKMKKLKKRSGSWRTSGWNDAWKWTESVKNVGRLI